jgi:hypothetical protein
MSYQAKWDEKLAEITEMFRRETGDYAGEFPADMITPEVKELFNRARAGQITRGVDQARAWQTLGDTLIQIRDHLWRNGN